MSHLFYSWIVLLAALLAANFPFLSNRVFGLFEVSERKSLPICLTEVFVFYSLVGGLGFIFEYKLGQIFSQDWEFYAITAAVFLTLCFPGFVYRYLLKSN